MAATLIGGGLGIVLSIWVFGLISPILGLYSAPLLISLSIGLCQDLILSRCMPDLLPWRWFMLTSVGAFLGWLSSTGILIIVPIVEFNGVASVVVLEALGGSVLGLSVGGTQWITLNSYSYHSLTKIMMGLIWMLSNTVAWASAEVIYRAFVRAHTSVGDPLIGALNLTHSQGWMLALLPVAVVTGLALMVVLRSNAIERD
jgi:hypothetical protein